MIRLHIIPQPGQFPQRGGVREHLLQLYNVAISHPNIKLVQREGDADIVHVESAYRSQSRVDVFTTHGGFLPSPPLQSVLSNLRDAKVIVSVAKWIADEFFPQYSSKTIVIPNGINLIEWDNIPPSGLEPGYVLYAKEIEYWIKDFVQVVLSMPNVRFVSTVWPSSLKVPSNLAVIGLQSHDAMKSIINDAGCLLLTGPEVCPTMLLEAWACKVPVVANYLGGAKEIMTGSSGTVFGGRLYDGIEDLKTKLENCLKWKQLGEHGRMVVEARYQWKDLFEQYVWVYENILEDTTDKIFKQAEAV